MPGDVPSSTVVVRERCFDRGNAVGFDPKNRWMESKNSVGQVDGYT